MCPTSAGRDLPARPSLDSLRKQAKRLARDAAAGNADAVARVHARLPRATFPLSNRDAQLVIAREYGFAGWSDLTAEVQKRQGRSLEWAASQATIAIHDRDHERLRVLLAEHPALVSWRDESDQTLLDSTTSYAMDCSDPERERTYTRPDAAEMLIDAGAIVERRTWENVIRPGASGLLRLFARKGALPRTLYILAALGDAGAVRARLDEGSPLDDDETIDDHIVIARSTMSACRFRHAAVALLLLERAIALEPELGRRIDRWQNRQAFVEYLIQHPGALWHMRSETTLWEAFVQLQLGGARDRNDLPAFQRWLDDEPWVLQPSFMHAQIDLMLPACYEKNREAFIVALLDRDPALLHADAPPASRWPLLVQALSHGNGHLVPLLTRIWPLPHDLPHAAGVGDAAAVARWFDTSGRPALGSLANHYPHSDPQFPRADLHWGPPTTQQVLDVALAWAVLNRHFAIATFLLERGANIDTDWATHEPASILHEAAIQGNEEAVRFLIDHGADLTKTDYRYRSNAEGWARYGSHDERMADVLAAAVVRVE
jgi:ankyrin repeat protein